MRTPEGLTKAEIKKVLDAYKPDLWYDMPVKFGMGHRVLDFIICFKGLFISIEAKRKDGKARKFQLRIIDQIRVAGGGAACIDNAAQLRALLKWIERHEVRLCGTTQITT